MSEITVSYLNQTGRKRVPAEAKAAALLLEAYGPQAPLAMARALHATGASSSLGGIFALLHRVLEETDLDPQRLYEELSEPAASLIEAVNARPGETPVDTAMRAVYHPQVSAILGSYGHNLRFPAQGQAEWWPSDAEAWKIVEADKERRDQLAKEEELRQRYDYKLPTTALEQAEVPVVWANAVLEPFLRLTDAEDHRRYRRNHHYDHNRVRRIKEGKHLVDCWRSGMSPEDYRCYVEKTQLTWTQFVPWYESGFSPQQAAEAAEKFKRDHKLLAYAVELAGSYDNALTLARLKRASTYYIWRDGPEAFERRADIKDFWEQLTQEHGSAQAVQARLALMRALGPIPNIASDKNREPYVEKLAAWQATGLSCERISLLVAAGVEDPAEAVSPEVAELSDNQLRMSVEMAASKS